MTTTTEAPAAELRGYELFVEALAHIVLDPSSWDQNHWLRTRFENDENAQDVLLEDLPEDLRARVKDDPYATYIPLPQLQAIYADLGQSCDTAACIAGWATLLAGAEPMFRTEGLDGYRQGQRVLIGESANVRWQGLQVSVKVLARELLGLVGGLGDTVFRDGEFLGELFGGTNTEDDLFEFGAVIYDVDEDTLRERVAVRAAQLLDLRKARAEAAKTAAEDFDVQDLVETMGQVRHARGEAARATAQVAEMARKDER